MSVLSKGLPSHLLFVLKSYFRLFWCFACLQPTLPPRVIYRGVLTNARVCGTEVQIFSNIFFYISTWKETQLLQKMVAIQKMFFWKKWNIKNCNFEPFCVLKKWGSYWEVATILLSIPFNELPWIWWLDREFWSSFGITRDYCSYIIVTHPISKLAYVCALFRVW